MRIHYRIGFQCVGVMLCLASTSLAFTFMPLDVPGATRTVATDINNHGEVVGYYVDSDAKTHGFLWSHGEFTTIDAPYPVSIIHPWGMNDVGDIVGVSGSQGFLLKDGVFTLLYTPEGRDVIPFDINNRGDIVGYYHAGTGIGNAGFLMDSDGGFLTYAPRASTLIQGINEAQEMVAVYGDIGGHGLFIDKKGHVTDFDIPNSQWTLPHGISGTGEIVGTVRFPSESVVHGFVLDPHGQVEFIDAPFSVQTQLWGVNTRGDIVGSFVDSAGFERGFIATR